MSIDVALCPRTHIIHPGGGQARPAQAGRRTPGRAAWLLGGRRPIERPRPTGQSTDGWTRQSRRRGSVRVGRATDMWEVLYRVHRLRASPVYRRGTTAQLRHRDYLDIARREPILTHHDAELLESPTTPLYLLHCALASGAVYCNRSCLCVCVFVAGGRCPNLTTASASAVLASL